MALGAAETLQRSSPKQQVRTVLYSNGLVSGSNWNLLIGSNTLPGPDKHKVSACTAAWHQAQRRHCGRATQSSRCVGLQKDGGCCWARGARPVAASITGAFVEVGLRTGHFICAGISAHLYAAGALVLAKLANSADDASSAALPRATRMALTLAACCCPCCLMLHRRLFYAGENSSSSCW
jgi:hypothetical protein